MKLYALFHSELDIEGMWSEPHLVGVYSSKKNAQKHEKTICEIWKSDSQMDWDLGTKFSDVNRIQIRPYNLNESDETYLSL